MSQQFAIIVFASAFVTLVIALGVYGAAMSQHPRLAAVLAILGMLMFGFIGKLPY